MELLKLYQHSWISLEMLENVEESSYDIFPRM